MRFFPPILKVIEKKARFLMPKFRISKTKEKAIRVSEIES